jgi:polyphosphate kinase
VLDLMLRDNVKARELRADGVYVRARRKAGQKRLDSQERQLEMSAQRLAQSMES